MSDGFQIVKSKKSRKVKEIKLVRSSSPVEVDTEKVLKQIKNIKSDLAISDFVKELIKNLRKALGTQEIKEIICLGIGRLSECSIAKHQLALLLIIQEELELKSVSKFYDPVISKSEEEVLKKLNCEILSDNKEGKYSIEHTTLFYLPHCPKQITNNLLFSNWNPQSLKNLILICNSFNKTITSSPERLLRPNAHYLLEIQPFTSEIELENSYKFTDIFNDFSIHTFPEEKLSSLPSLFWDNHIEPVYLSEDLEFVKNGSGD